MNTINLLEIFGDESGSISRNRPFPYFVVCLISPKNVKKLKNDFKRWKLKETGKLNKPASYEIKGSSLSDAELLSFVNMFSSDLYIFAGVLNCNTTSNRIISNPKVTYNFIINKVFERMIAVNTIKENSVVHFQLDNVNNGVGSLKSLEDYLNAMHINETNIITINVNYFISSNNWKIQVADIFTHYVYRAIQKKWTIAKNIEIRNIY